MAEKLTPEKIEEIAKNFENIQSGKTPIIKSEKEKVKLDYGSLDKLRPKDKSKTSAPEKRLLPLIPPSDPRLLMQIAPFMDDTLQNFDFKDRIDLSKVMYDNMVKYGGLGLSANQVGLPYRMFIMGGHPSIEEGKVRAVFNPLINDISEETINLKEGCLSYPFLFLMINRPKWCSVKYTDQHGKEIEETLHGMPARVFQHENEHMNGYVFTDLVSKFKLERAEKARTKMLKKMTKQRLIRK
jgi:peptide deformylase